MGGSGGYFPGRLSPEQLSERIREAEKQALDQEFNAAVAMAINKLLASFNNRDTAAITRHLDAITAALESDIQGKIYTLFGGSVMKHTYVEGLSDVDALVILNESSLVTASPLEALAYFQRRLQERLPETKVTLGRLAVTVHFRDAEVQLLPAVKSESHVKIPSAQGDGWTSIDPERFAKALTDINRANSSKVVPAIKLVKSINSRLRDDQQLSGYHIEALAIEVFRGYDGPQTTKAMLQHFLATAPSRVMTPISDITGQADHVDDYLGAPGSEARSLVGNAYDRVYRRLQNADGSRSVEQWIGIISGE